MMAEENKASKNDTVGLFLRAMGESSRKTSRGSVEKRRGNNEDIPGCEEECLRTTFEEEMRI